MPDEKEECVVFPGFYRTSIEKPSCSRLKGKVRRVRVGKLYSVQVRYRRTDRRSLHLRGASAKKPIDSQR